jgi:arginine metabolism regulation protein II
MQEARSYLLDVELLVSRFGANRSYKSRKVRMLHSNYLYLRVLEQSTNLQIGQSEQADRQTSSFGQLSSASTSYRRSSIWTDDLISDPQSSESSIQNTTSTSMIPRRASIATFEHIYSIPASLFKLISQTTEVAREMEQARGYRGWPSTDIDIFGAEVKALEHQICTWQNHHGHYDSDVTEQTASHHLAEAVHAALMIYFYRRVRDLHPTAVQHWVKKTAQHLLALDELKARCGDRSANLCWPGFIAGCESTDRKTRAELSDWLERSYKSTNIGMFKVADSAMRSVWRSNTYPEAQAHCWYDALREASDSTPLVLS